jgi:hypothetical protein
MFGEELRGESHAFGRNAFALQVLNSLDGGVFGNAQHPTDGTARNFGKSQFGNFLDIGIGLDDPVMSGQPGIQCAVGDVSCHLLSTNQETFDFVVVDGGNITSRLNGQVVSTLAKEFKGGFLQTASGNTKF